MIRTIFIKTHFILIFSRRNKRFAFTAFQGWIGHMQLASVLNRLAVGAWISHDFSPFAAFVFQTFDSAS